MNTPIQTLALVMLVAAAGASQAADKHIEIASWSLGCSNPTLSSSTAQGRAGYDVKKNDKARAAAPDCSASDDKSPRDAATGQASGQATSQTTSKRQHSPVTFNK